MNTQTEYLQVKTDEETYEGLFVKEDDTHIFLKLKSGYNIGIYKNKIKNKEVLKTINSHHKDKPHAAHHNKDLPKITLLHTGGTIASKVDYETGATIARFTPEEILQLFPELAEIANVDSKLVSNMMSENMRFHHYNVLAKAIVEEIAHATDGIIITHGTDTLHYTAAALSFALQNITIPVILIGSQRSSDRPSTDSAVNLICAAKFIANAKTPGVFVCLHSGLNDDKCTIIEGVNSRKMHSSRRDAFRPINKTAIATIDYASGKVEVIRKIHHSKEPFTMKLFDEKIKVGIVKIHPQMFYEELAAYDNFDGLIIEGTGLGHAQIIALDEFSSENKRLHEKISQLAKKMPVAMTVQTIYGRVNMNVYSPGRDLIEMGLAGNNCDMTPETGFIKLAWLISQYKKDLTKIKEEYEKNLCGEISDRSEKETFLI